MTTMDVIDTKDTDGITLGRKYRDYISGFEGIAVSRSEFLHGCVRVLLEGPVKPDGEAREFFVDEQRLVDVETETRTLVAKAGGPQTDVRRATDVRR